MWNSSYEYLDSERGRQYRLEEISALIYPIEMLLDEIGMFPASQVTCEKILVSLERDEMVFAIYETLQALLEDIEIPEGGHTGIQQGLVAELLAKAHADIENEMYDGFDFDFSVRAAVWQSVEHLLIKEPTEEYGFPMILEELGFSRNDEKIYRSEKLTSKVWEELLLGECYLFGEFFQDDDWRMDFLMDLPPDTAEALTKTIGLDLQRVQALPHTPNQVELERAENYIRDVIRRSKELNPEERPDLSLEEFRCGPDDVPF